MKLRQARKIRKLWKQQFERYVAVEECKFWTHGAEEAKGRLDTGAGVSTLADRLISTMGSRPPIQTWHRLPKINPETMRRAYFRLPSPERIDWFIDFQIVRKLEEHRDNPWGWVARQQHGFYEAINRLFPAPPKEDQTEAVPA